MHVVKIPLELNIYIFIYSLWSEIKKQLRYRNPEFDRKSGLNRKYINV